MPQTLFNRCVPKYASLISLTTIPTAIARRDTFQRSAVSTSAAPVVVNFSSAVQPSKSAGLTTDPPETAAQKATGTETAVSKTAASTSAAVESASHKVKSRPKRNSKIPSITFCTLDEDEGKSSSSEDIYQPSEDIQQQPARRSIKRRKRRSPVRKDECYNPPCDRCIRVKYRCFMEAWGGACYWCVKAKRRCKYSKGVIEESDSEDRNVKEKKGKAKARKAQESKDSEFIEISDEDGLDPLGSTPERVDVSDNDDVKKAKQPKPAAATGQLLSPASGRMYSFH